VVYSKSSPRALKKKERKVLSGIMFCVFASADFINIDFSALGSMNGTAGYTAGLMVIHDGGLLFWFMLNAMCIADVMVALQVLGILGFVDPF
jgi:hypothetical protein